MFYYIYRIESKFAEEEFARLAYNKAVRRHLKNGTTFAAYFATIHLNSSKILADIIKQLGQRAFVGKVNMDRNSPEFYIEDTQAGVDDTEVYIRHILNQTETGIQFLESVDREAAAGAVTEEGMNNNSSNSNWFVNRPTLLNKVTCPLLLPIVTPRFVPTCTSEMMNKLGYLAYKYGLPIQSHLSENL